MTEIEPERKNIKQLKIKIKSEQKNENIVTSRKISNPEKDLNNIVKQSLKINSPHLKKVTESNSLKSLLKSEVNSYRDL